MAALDVGELLHQKAAAEDAAQAEAARNAELQQQMAQVLTLCCHCCLHSDTIWPKGCLCTSPELLPCELVKGDFHKSGVHEEHPSLQVSILSLLLKLA